MSELERRQRLTRGNRKSKTHWVRYVEAGVMGGRFVTLCRKRMGVNESKQVWDRVDCVPCVQGKVEHDRLQR